jgi:hypothetical protein
MRMILAVSRKHGALVRLIVLRIPTTSLTGSARRSEMRQLAEPYYTPRGAFRSAAGTIAPTAGIGRLEPDLDDAAFLPWAPPPGDTPRPRDGTHTTAVRLYMHVRAENWQIMGR